MTGNGTDCNYNYRVHDTIYGSYDEALSAAIREQNGTSGDSTIYVIPNRTY